MKAFKLPSSIKVLTETYKVRVVKGLIESEQAEGMCDPGKYTIYIDDSLLLTPRALKRTFYHEVGHAFAFECGLHECLAASSIEMFCQSFSALICQVKQSL